MSTRVISHTFLAMAEERAAHRFPHSQQAPPAAPGGVGFPANSPVVRRITFGDANDINTNEDASVTTTMRRKMYDEFHEEDMRQKRERWGFDFERERPVENEPNSRYRWERIKKDVPKAYSLDHLGLSLSFTPDEHQERNSSPTSMDDAEPEQSPRSSSETRSKQTHITDYMRVKRKYPGDGGPAKRQRTVSAPEASTSSSQESVA